MKQKWIGTGWKMNFVLAEAQAYLGRLREFLTHREDDLPAVFLVPPFTVLRDVCAMAADLPVLIGAQNMHWATRGAFTGEISPRMVKDCGAQLVELGHSERRAMFGETDFTVNNKVHAALGHGLRPLICLGESGPEKEFGGSRPTVLRQLNIALHGVPAGRMDEVILAYEPVWAIGEAGAPAEPAYANAMHTALRQGLVDLYGADTAARVPVLYGGSVTLENAAALVSQPEIDGLFVGRTAWNVDGLIELITIGANALRRS